MEGEPGGIFGFGGEFGGREAAGGDVEAGAVNALAGGFGVGVGAEVDKELLLGSEGAGSGGEHGEGEGAGAEHRDGGRESGAEGRG